MQTSKLRFLIRVKCKKNYPMWYLRRFQKHKRVIQKIYTVSSFRGTRLGGRGTPRYSISTSQDFTTALESPTSQPRINKGDLWQGRERKKRGKETSDPSPSPKVPRHTRKGRVVLRLRQRLNSDYFHSTGQRGQAGCCHLSRGRLCTRWIRISNLQSAVPHTSVRTGYLKKPQYSTAVLNVSY